MRMDWLIDGVGDNSLFCGFLTYEDAISNEKHNFSLTALLFPPRSVIGSVSNGLLETGNNSGFQGDFREWSAILSLHLCFTITFY